MSDTVGGASLTILLVEDDALVRETTVELISELEHAVIATGSAEEAIALLNSHRIDALMTDINLPGMSGEVLAAEARAIHPTIAIVFVTGRADIQAPKIPGFDPIVLHKPFDLAALQQVLSRLATR